MLIKGIDTDGDGRINYTEFITATFDREVLLSNKNLNTVFKIFDANGDGEISIDELKAVFSRGNASCDTEEKWD